MNDILTGIALFGAAIAALGGLIQYMRNDSWKRAEWVAEETKAFFGDPLVQAALYMIDWDGREILLFPESESASQRRVIVTDEMVCGALQSHHVKGRFTRKEAAIRDAFDCFFSGVDRFESYVRTGLIEDKWLLPYLGYWAQHIMGRTASENAKLQQLRVYMRTYGFESAEDLLKRLEKLRRKERVVRRRSGAKGYGQHD